MCDGLCCVCVLVRRGAITGTLDPVRNLTGLTELDVSTNSIGGMSVRTAVGMVVVVLECGWQGGWISRQHRPVISHRRITLHGGAVWKGMVVVVLMLGQRAARQPVVFMTTCVCSRGVLRRCVVVVCR